MMSIGSWTLQFLDYSLERAGMQTNWECLSVHESPECQHEQENLCFCMEKSRDPIKE